MDSWERFDETSLPDKKEFYSSLNMENITVVDHRHTKRVFKYFSNTNLGDYHDLYVQVIHHYLLMYLKALEVNFLKYMKLILFIFYQSLD